MALASADTAWQDVAAKVFSVCYGATFGVRAGVEGIAVAAHVAVDQPVPFLSYGVLALRWGNVAFSVPWLINKNAGTPYLRGTADEFKSALWILQAFAGPTASTVLLMAKDPGMVRPIWQTGWGCLHVGLVAWLFGKEGVNAASGLAFAERLLATVAPQCLQFLLIPPLKALPPPAGPVVRMMSIAPTAMSEMYRTTA